jgi:hypothetical protein
MLLLLALAALGAPPSDPSACFGRQIPGPNSTNGQYLLYPRHYIAHRAPAGVAPALDGNIKEPFWEEVPWTEEFGDICGSENYNPNSSPMGGPKCTEPYKTPYLR